MAHTHIHTEEELRAQTPTWHGGMLDRYPLRSASSDGAVWITEHEGATGTAPPMHRHSREDETFYVVEGEIVAYVNGEEHPLQAGTALFVPRGAAHTFKIVSATARLLTIGAPGGMDQFFRDAGDAATSLTIPPAAKGPTPKLLAACEQYGVEVLGPAPA